MPAKLTFERETTQVALIQINGSGDLLRNAHRARLLRQQDTQQRTVNFEVPVVIDETQFTKLVHEVADPRSGRPDHFCKGLLTDLGENGLGLAFFPEIGQQQQQTRKPFLRRIEELVDQVLFDAGSSRQDMRDEHLRKRRLVA